MEKSLRALHDYTILSVEKERSRRAEEGKGKGEGKRERMKYTKLRKKNRQPNVLDVLEYNQFMQNMKQLQEQGLLPFREEREGEREKEKEKEEEGKGKREEKETEDQ